VAVKIEAMQIGIAAHGAGPEGVQFVRDAERLSVSSGWVAEAWGQGAFTPLAYLAAR
jgi:alkanesulfonate monooxygenase SsuD/methylene tetrahydromethanopterin reductase-like flavin-dependent oxidoreductase (luciferase family)